MQDVNSIYVAFGNYVRECRKKLHMSQGDLAEKAGMEQYQISNIENAKSGTGMDKLDRMNAICDALGQQLLIQVGDKIMTGQEYGFTYNFEFDLEPNKKGFTDKDGNFVIWDEARENRLFTYAIKLKELRIKELELQKELATSKPE